MGRGHEAVGGHEVSAAWDDLETERFVLDKGLISPQKLARLKEENPGQNLFHLLQAQGILKTERPVVKAEDSEPSGSERSSGSFPEKGHETLWLRHSERKHRSFEEKEPQTRGSQVSRRRKFESVEAPRPILAPTPAQPSPESSGWRGFLAFEPPDPANAPARVSSRVSPEASGPPSPKMTPEELKFFLRSLGIREDPVVFTMDREAFYREKSIHHLGGGGESEVYFLRGHVVKVLNPDGFRAGLREIAHLLYLNPPAAGEVMGERQRHDWPALVWTYLFTDGGLCIGMRTFDPEEETPGQDLRSRLTLGPSLYRGRILSLIRSLAESLAYAQTLGFIHHDLKPENVWVPADPARVPILFDLAQALWKQSIFGRDWARHEHNNGFWYNGTYRYMHRLRRQAHMAARDVLRARALTPMRAKAMETYVPCFFDDVFSFARIIRDIVRSPYAQLLPHDRELLRELYRRLMETGGQLNDGPVPAPKKKSSRLTTLFFKRPALPEKISDQPSLSMAGALKAVREVLDRLDGN